MFISDNDFIQYSRLTQLIFTVSCVRRLYCMKSLSRTMKVDYLRVQVWRATCEACSGNLEVSGTIPAFALVHRETKDKPVSKWPVSGPPGH